MSKPKFKIIGTNLLLKAFCYDCLLAGVPVSKANSFFRDDWEHCLMPAYAYDNVQPDNIKLQTLSSDVYYPDLVFNLEEAYNEALAFVQQIAATQIKEE